MDIMNAGEKKHPPRFQNGFATALSVIITFHL